MAKLSREEKHKQRIALPIEEKESLRWLESIRATKKLAEECSETRCVNISDSEGDIFELFVEPRATDNFHWIIRAGQDRTALDIQGDSLGMIRDALLQQPVLATDEISVRARN